MSKTYENVEQFAVACNKLGASFEKLAGLLHTLVIVACNKAYGSKDKGGEWVATLLNPMPQYIRAQLVRHLVKVGGLNIPSLEPGQTNYVIPNDCVVDRKRQAVCLDLIKTKPPIIVEQRKGKVVKEKVLVGSAQDRANKAIESLIARVKKTDAEGAAVLNEMFTMQRAMCLYDNEGKRIALSPGELDACLNVLIEEAFEPLKVAA